jgi:CheY-like chemotaxis protein
VITRRIIELHQGKISAISNGRDQGSIFAIEIPLVNEAGAKVVGKDVARLSGSGTSVVRTAASRSPYRARVLVVEDHAATRTTLAHLLTRRQFDVVAASTIQEARAAVQANRFDLIVSDIGLPDGSGYGLMTEIRAAQPSTPGIALSGYGMEEDINRSQAAGFAAHLTKPIDVKNLDELIVRLLPGRVETSSVT